MNIRLCKLEDERVWIELNREFMNFEIQADGLWNNTNKMSYSTFQHTFTEAMEHPELITLFLIESGDKIIGFANLMTIYSVWAHGKALILDDLFIKSEYRKLGFGKKTLHFIEDYAKENGYKRIQFQSEFTNPGAYAFYVKLGYEPVDMHFYVKYM